MTASSWVLPDWDPALSKLTLDGVAALEGGVQTSDCDELLSFADVDAYREEGAQYILKRVKALPQTTDSA